MYALADAMSKALKHILPGMVNAETSCHKIAIVIKTDVFFSSGKNCSYPPCRL